jgi:hypothetical protein
MAEYCTIRKYYTGRQENSRCYAAGQENSRTLDKKTTDMNKRMREGQKYSKILFKMTAEY